MLAEDMLTEEDYCAVYYFLEKWESVDFLSVARRPEVSKRRQRHFGTGVPKKKGGVNRAWRKKWRTPPSWKKKVGDRDYCSASTSGGHGRYCLTAEVEIALLLPRN